MAADIFLKKCRVWWYLLRSCTATDAGLAMNWLKHSFLGNYPE